MKYSFKYNEETCEARNNRHKEAILPNIVTLSVCIAMVIGIYVNKKECLWKNNFHFDLISCPKVGLQYSSEEDCRYSGAPTFLVFGGGIVLTTTTLNIVAYLTPCGWDDKITDAIITPMAHLINMIVLVWGSISIFSNIPILINRQWKL